MERDKIDQNVGKACKSRGTSAQDIRDVLSSPEFIKYQGLGLCITRLDRVYHHEGMPSIHIAAYPVRIARLDHDGIHVPSLQIHTTSLLLTLHGPITEPSIFDVISPGVPLSHLPDEAKVPPTRNSTTRHHQGLGGVRSLAIDLWVGKGLKSASFREFRLDDDGVHYRCPTLVSLNCREVPQLLEMASSLL